MENTKVVIAHDYLTQRGGAERLVLSICKAFPQATVHTLFYAPDQTFPEYKDIRVKVSGLNKVTPFRRDPRIALPFLAAASKRMLIDADVVVASSSGWAHAFPTTGKKIVYCHSPARWLYLEEDYLGQAGTLDPKRLALTALKSSLVKFDQNAALSADRYIANSTVVKERIKSVYGFESGLLFPPFSPSLVSGEQSPISDDLTIWARKGGYHLVVSRLQPYKNVDKVIDAFRLMPEHRLLVIGKGPLGAQLRASAPSNVRLVQGLSDAQMRWAYSHAKCLIAASHEDFGLTPLESGSHGVPILALKAGGYLDTIRPGVNGDYFLHASAEGIREAVLANAEKSWDKEKIKSYTDGFSEENFIYTLKSEVEAMISG